LSAIFPTPPSRKSSTTKDKVGERLVFAFKDQRAIAMVLMEELIIIITTINNTWVVGVKTYLGPL